MQTLQTFATLDNLFNFIKLTFNEKVQFIKAITVRMN